MLKKGILPETDLEEVEWVDTFTGTKEPGPGSYKPFFKVARGCLELWESAPVATERRREKLESLLSSFVISPLAKQIASYVSDPAFPATSNSLLAYFSYAWGKGGEIPDPSPSSPAFLSGPEN